ncbi:Hypp2180 [Branchiostoma lanceolatum]|uniref:Hypp2180 protein n=1 Tax=Branchiostoma lanceolatum TaxID=7740 RepID=A0A8J9ZRQ3_BRALA|nr:Hypp2180 [Branchiostoma lanceolatum]
MDNRESWRQLVMVRFRASLTLEVGNFFELQYRLRLRQADRKMRGRPGSTVKSLWSGVVRQGGKTEPSSRSAARVTEGRTSVSWLKVYYNTTVVLLNHLERKTFTPSVLKSAPPKARLQFYCNSNVQPRNSHEAAHCIQSPHPLHGTTSQARYPHGHLNPSYTHMNRAYSHTSLHRSSKKDPGMMDLLQDIAVPGKFLTMMMPCGRVKCPQIVASMHSYNPDEVESSDGSISFQKEHTMITNTHL